MNSSHAHFYGAISIYLLSYYFLTAISSIYPVSHVQSEWLCWCILLGLSKIVPSARSLQDEEHEDRPDKLAMAITAVCLFKSLGRVEWAVPLLIPLVLFLVQDDTSSPKLLVEPQEKFDAVQRVLTMTKPPHLILTLLVAAASAAVLLPFPPTNWDIGAGVSFTGSSLLVYMLLMERSHERRLGFASPTEQSPPSITPLPTSATAWRVVAILTMMMLATSKGPPHLPSMSVVAAAKSLQWMAVIDLINRGHVMPTSTMATFSVASMQAFHPPSTTGFVWFIASVALISLVQTYRAIHRFAYSQRIIAVVGCTFLIALVSYRAISEDRPGAGNTRTWSSTRHPIEILAEEATAKYNNMRDSQSKTLEAAIVEYERRYNRPPPPGFDYWFKVAQEANTTIIDNYDTIMNTLEPFWGISAKEVRARSDMITESPMAVFAIYNHTLRMEHDSLVLAGFGETVRAWLEAHEQILPDFKFIINGLAEPRVIVPNDRMNHLISSCPPIEPNTTSLTPPDENRGRHPLEILDLGKHSAWQVGTSSCPESSPSRSILLPTAPKNLIKIPFITNATLAKDWCQTPEAAQTHGMFVAPYNLKVTSTLVPIFSHGKPSTSQDILYPSPDYVEQEGKHHESDDPAWEEKFNQMYWAGSDTGGYAIGDNWRHFHRQRFVDLITNSAREVALLARRPPNRLQRFLGRKGKYEMHEDTMANLTDLVDVHLSDLAACDAWTCDEEREALPVLDVPDPGAVMYQHKFLFDVDGMGRTERYYRLLGSRSCVLKQTMHQEWHDDRLVPWYHYVPVSLGMQELPEVIRFLAGTEEGDRIGERIAEQGREFAQRSLRAKDLELAFLRLLLEYVRLVGDERDAQGLCPGGRVRDESPE